MDDSLKTTLSIDESFFAPPDGADKAIIRKLAIERTHPEVLAGNLIPTGDLDFQSYYLFNWHRIVNNVGDKPLKLDDATYSRQPGSGIVTLDDVWGITLFRPSYNGLAMVDNIVQGGFLSPIDAGKNASDTVLQAFEGGQYYNMTGKPFGFYQFVIRIDPLGKWSLNNKPVVVKLQYSISGSKLLTDFPPEAFIVADPVAQGKSIVDLQTKVATLTAAVDRLTISTNRLTNRA